MLNRKELLSLFVAALMLLSTVFTGIAPAFAEDAEEPNDPAVTEPAGEEPEESEEAVPEPEETEPEVIDPDLDTDGDGVPDVDEITFGTDPENADTDGDGLSDYDELYVYHTAAGETDSDGDGLSDYDEVHVYGTDPVKGDTDADGLSDGDELKQGTDPKNPDSDGDGILDGDELILGTDPLKAEDISDVFQSSDGLVDGVTIEGYAPFVLFREGVVMPYGVDSFLNNPALVGTPVEIRLPEGGDLTLKLTVKSSAKEIAIFRMNENGTVRLDAAKSGKTFSLPLEENGVYYAADLQKLNVLLGFEGAGKQSVPENSYLLEDFRTVTLSAPLTAGSDVDTDGDGIPDCEEIGEQYAIDLGNGYTATVYGHVSDPTLVDSDFDGIRDDLDTLPRSNNFSATYKSGDFTINLTYSMDYRDFLGDSTVYNVAIASFSVWAAQLAYDNDITFTPGETLYDSDGSVITNARRIDTLMRAHGMENVIDYQLENGYFDSDISLSAYSDDDITEVFFGHHKITEGGEDYEIISVFVRGTNGTIQEWSSNFNIGDLYRYDKEYDVSSVKNFKELNGDWNRKSNHRGFDVCATRIYRALAAYMNQFVDSDATPVFWLAGHSRGAAIANIVSATYVDEGHKVFAYTYASPNTTANTEASAAKYDCIFNLVNGDDFVPRLPMPAWGFSRYGRTATIFASTASNSLRSTYLGNTSYNCKSDSDLQALVNKFANMTKNNAGGNDGWRDVYVYHCGHQHADEQKGEDRSGCTRTQQWSELIGWGESMFTGWSQRVQRYAYWSSSENGICETPAYAMQVLAELMGNLSLSGGWDYLTTNKLADRYDFGKTSLVNYATSIADPHYMENYYLIQTALLSEPDTTFNTNNSLYTNASHRPQHTHSYEIVEIKQAPTCTEPGVAHVICRCSQVNSAWYDDEIKNALIPATGHNYGTPAWTWDGLTAATFTCANDGTHVETRSTTDIVRTENGDLAVYTATVEFEGQTYTDTKEVEIGYYLIGSMTDWEVDETYRFTANAAAEGEYILNVADLAIGAEIKVVRAEGATKLNWYPDYGGNYTVDYPHSGSVNVYFRPAGNVWNDFFTGGFFYISRLHTAEVIAVGGGEASLDPANPDVTATVTVVVPANDSYHYRYVEIYKRTGAGENDLERIELGGLNWNETHRTFTMPDYDVVVKVYFAAHTWSGWTVTTPPTCTEAGEETRTCSDCGATETRPVAATGHNWGPVDYDWAEDYTYVTASRVCQNDIDHSETEDAFTMSEVKTPATCEGKGTTTYTATFTNEAFETQIKDVEDIPATGHDWILEPTWAWEGVESATATFVCRNDSEHTTVLDATITSAVDGDDTVYTATVEFQGETYTDEKRVPLGPAFMTQSLLLEGKIGVRFYVRLPEALRNESTNVSFTISGKGGDACTATVPFSSDLPTNTNGYYGFTYYVGVIQMADTITATLNYTVDGEAQTLEKTYSVKEYFKAFDENYAAHPELYTNENVVELIKATADLGHYVQAYLDEARSEWSVPTDHAAMDKVYANNILNYLDDAATAVASHALAVEGSNTDIKSLGYALVMDSDTTIRVTIVPKSGFTGTITATVDGEAVEVKKISKVKYAVDIPNVQAHELSKQHTIEITTENGTVTLTGSGLSFVKMLLDAYPNNETVQNAAIAIWRYSKFADIVRGISPEANRK